MILIKETIYELWNGHVPCLGSDDRDEEMKKLRKLILCNREQLCSDLNAEQKSTLEKYDACTDEVYDFDTEKAFCDGFMLAMRIAVETLG